MKPSVGPACDKCGQVVPEDAQLLKVGYYDPKTMPKATNGQMGSTSQGLCPNCVQEIFGGLEGGLD